MMTVFEKFTGQQGGGPSLVLPVALLAVAFLAAIGFQTLELMRDRNTLSGVYAGQEAAVEQTLRLRNSVDAFAGDTAKLAQAGDPQAKQVVDALRSQNISIRPPAATTAAAP
jgi:uncharacterized protein YggE